MYEHHFIIVNTDEGVNIGVIKLDLDFSSFRKRLKCMLADHYGTEYDEVMLDFNTTTLLDHMREKTGLFHCDVELEEHKTPLHLFKTFMY